VARARRIQHPFLIQVLEDETVLPVPPMRKAARRAPRGRAISYSGLDHFDIYVGDGFERLVEDQLLFLNDVVGQPI
jgi:hypothetical protein